MPDDLTIVAVDWSGDATAAGQRTRIWMAVVADGGPVELSCGRTRAQVVGEVASLRGRAVVGLDFSFAFPAWVPACRGCSQARDVWALAQAEGEDWLRHSPAPFWREAGTKPAVPGLRRTEEQNPPAQSIFKLVGNGQVGPGSVRGMPFLGSLQDSGWSIWPFDAPGDRTIVEIYPRLAKDLHGLPAWGHDPPTAVATLEAHFPAAGLRRHRDRLASSLDAFDAAVAALVMWEHRDDLVALARATDPLTLIEGEIWRPRRIRAPGRQDPRRGVGENPGPGMAAARS